MRNEHPGPCYRCGKIVLAGDGHFEKHKGGWRTQHADCAIKYRGTGVEYVPPPGPAGWGEAGTIAPLAR